MNSIHPITGSEDGKYVKVVIDLAESEWHNYATETLWATSVNKKGVFRIENIPFYAYGMSYLDLITVRFSSDMLLFKEVYQRCGHSTYRIFLSENCSWDEFEMMWKPLATLGCSYEQATERLMAVDVPPTTNIYHAYELLEKGEQNQIWDFEEAHCGHPLK